MAKTTIEIRNGKKSNFTDQLKLDVASGEFGSVGD
jgi:hypothetical protein